MSDLIERQDALDAIDKAFERSNQLNAYIRAFMMNAISEVKKLPPAQPKPSDITDEQAILHLQSTGWMQNHDREMYESGLKKRLADDSVDYDSLIPCEDTISRQQTITALRALSDEDGYINAPHEVVTDVVRGLPPVKVKQGQTTRSERGETDKSGVKTGETCEDCISRQAAIDVAREELESGTYFDIPSKIESLPSAQLELCEDAVSRQRLLSALKKLVAAWKKYPVMAEEIKGVEAAIGYVELIPSVKPNLKELSETHNALDTISRQAAIEALEKMSANYGAEGRREWHPHIEECKSELRMLPSAQPERRCVNCGRTLNNGGWYADGRTRCPIEEHYALPKDGYCHLWEERNVTDDDYPERREE